MAQAIRKRKQQDDDFADILGDAPVTVHEHKLEQEPSIDDLLGDEPLPTASRTTVPKVTAPRVPREPKGIMVSFMKGKTNVRITGPATPYYVVKDAEGKLHYKACDECIILPPDWKEGDPTGLEDPADR